MGKDLSSSWDVAHTVIVLLRCLQTLASRNIAGSSALAHSLECREYFCHRFIYGRSETSDLLGRGRSPEECRVALVANVGRAPNFEGIRRQRS